MSEFRREQRLEALLRALGRIDVPAALTGRVIDRLHVTDPAPTARFAWLRTALVAAGGVVAVALLTAVLPLVVPPPAGTLTPSQSVSGSDAHPTATASTLSPSTSMPTEGPPRTIEPSEFEFVRWLEEDVPVVIEPGSTTVIGSTGGDALALVLDRVELDGLEWLRVQLGRGNAQTHLVNGWVALEAEVERGGSIVRIGPVYQPTAVNCPDQITVTQLDGMHPGQALRCFGREPLSFSPVLVRDEGAEERELVAGKPEWLAIASELVMYDAEGVALTGSIRIHVDPESGVEVPLGQWLEVQGSFDHPASSSCQRDSELPEFALANRDEAELWCRERFVVSAARVLPPAEQPTYPPQYTPGPKPSGTIEVESREVRAPIPARYYPSAVWTGSEVIVWGGVELLFAGDQYLRSDGAAYMPDSDSWRRIAAAPLDGRHGHLAVWTGTEMLIWGGDKAGGQAPDGAAYDPAADTWRRIADSPLKWGPSGGVWTGTEWVIASTTEAGTVEVAAYSPSANTWRSLPSVAAGFGLGNQLAWFGNELILRDSGTGMHRLSPEAAAWEPVADPPEGSPWDTVAIGERIIGIAVRNQYQPDGDSYSWGFLTEWQASTDTWATLPMPPTNLYNGQLVAAGSRAIVLGAGVAYDTESSTWLAVPSLSIDRLGSAAVWTGDELFVWGGGRGAPFDPQEEGVVLVPRW